MISFEDIKKYLPQYLSDISQDNLFEELKKFPENIDHRLYSDHLIKDNIIYQGDGVNGLLFINFPDHEIKPLPAMVLSNTCDIDPLNKRLFPSRIVYAPILKLEKYRQMLTNAKIKIENINNHIETIKRQSISNIFYLPKGGNLEDDSISFLDRLNNCPIEILGQNNIKEIKLFTLSNYGFYMFLVKLSIHFTRIRENIDRNLH